MNNLEYKLIWYKQSEVPCFLENYKKSPPILVTDTKGMLHLCHYFPDKWKNIESDDWDDYEPEHHPYTIPDEKNGVIWLKEGFYESIDCDRCDPYWSSPIDVAYWARINKP